MAGRDDPKITARVAHADRAQLLGRAGALKVKEGRLVGALVSHAVTIPLAELERIVSAFDDRLRAARAAGNPPGSAVAGAASSPAPARPSRRPLIEVMVDRGLPRLLAAREIRLGNVQVDGREVRNPDAAVDPSAVSM